MRKLTLLIAAAGLVFSLQTVAHSGDSAAKATLKGTDGKTVGTVWFSPAETGVKVSAEITGLAAGEHAFHIHGTGVCEAPSFKTAGGHYNPGNMQHGFLNAKGPHAGDMPNITVGGENKYQWITSLVSLDENADNTLFPEQGTAIVIHQNPDDYITDPAGKGGTRIACGVIEKSKK